MNSMKAVDLTAEEAKPLTATELILITQHIAALAPGGSKDMKNTDVYRVTFH